MPPLFCSMKRIIICLFVNVLLVLCLTTSLKAEKIYDVDLSKGQEEQAKDALQSFFEALPDGIRDSLPDNKESFESYDVEYFAKKAEKAIKGAAPNALKTLFAVMGTVLIASVFHMLSSALGDCNLEKAFSLCSTLCVALSIFQSMKGLFSVAESLLDILTKTMIPLSAAMETLYIASGNVTGAAVLSTGIGLMTALTEGLFSRVIYPFVYAAFILAVVSAVTGNRAVAFMSKTIRGLVTGGVIFIMTLVTFVLALQSAGAAAADTLASKTVKFALGSYLPIVGGAVSESFSLLASSLSAIKSTCTVAGAAALTVAFMIPMASVILYQISLGAASALSGILGAEKESALLSECRGICTILMAICAGGAVMFIIALGIFAKTPVAVS